MSSARTLFQVAIAGAKRVGRKQNIREKKIRPEVPKSDSSVTRKLCQHFCKISKRSCNQNTIKKQS